MAGLLAAVVALLAAPAPDAGGAPAPTLDRRCTVYVAGATSQTNDLAIVRQGIQRQIQETTEITVHTFKTLPQEDDSQARTRCEGRAKEVCNGAAGGCRYEVTVGAPRGWEAATALGGPPKAEPKPKKKGKHPKKKAGAAH